jgi:hypothetical protein
MPKASLSSSARTKVGYVPFSTTAQRIRFGCEVGLPCSVISITSGFRIDGPKAALIICDDVCLFTSGCLSTQAFETADTSAPVSNKAERDSL